MVGLGLCVSGAAPAMASEGVKVLARVREAIPGASDGVDRPYDGVNGRGKVVPGPSDGMK